MMAHGSTQGADGFFSRGFKPFFLASAILAALAAPLWALSFTGRPAFPGEAVTLDWHAHELIFGYCGGVIAGFALTAVPNWTGRLPVSGRPLMGLFTLWLAGRLGLLAAPAIGALASAMLDIAFLAALAGYLINELIAGRNMRNLPVAGLVSMLALANLAWHACNIAEWDLGPAQRAGLAAVSALITLIGGRVTPSFTHNWLMRAGRKRDMPSTTPLDKIAIALTAAALVVWIAAPESVAAGALLLAAGLSLALRMSRWHGWRTGAEPLVTILHIGYLWLAVAFVLLGLAALTPDLVEPQMALHGLTAGAIGTMTLAIMTRASLGHTGADLTADKATVAIYLLATVGAALRTFAAAASDSYPLLIGTGATLWSGAFALFAVSYGPRLLRSGAGK